MIKKEEAINSICSNCTEYGHCTNECPDVKSIRSLKDVNFVTYSDIVDVIKEIDDLKKDLDYAVNELKGTIYTVETDSEVRDDVLDEKITSLSNNIESKIVLLKMELME